MNEEELPTEVHKRESMKAPPDMKTGRSIFAHMSELRCAHEARSRVKKKDSCKSEGTQRRPHPKERQYSKTQERGNGRPRAVCVVVLEVPDANLGAVNDHKELLEEHAACKKRRVTKSRASQTETTASSASGDQKRRHSERRYSEDRIRVKHTAEQIDPKSQRKRS